MLGVNKFTPRCFLLRYILLRYKVVVCYSFLCYTHFIETQKKKRAYKMIQWLSALFSSDKIGDTILDYVRDKTGLNDLTEKDRLEFEKERITLLTEYQKATRHQSPMRRVIAFGVFALMFLFVLAWLVVQSVGTLLDMQEYVYMAARIKQFYTEVLLMPTSLVLGFYFGVGAVNSFKANNKGATNG